MNHNNDLINNSDEKDSTLNVDNANVSLPNSDFATSESPDWKKRSKLTTYSGVN